MAEINKFLFVESENRKHWVMPEEFNGDYSLIGYCVREGFEDNSFVKTSPVVSLKDGVATTKSGSDYVLRDMAEDYKEFLEAVKNGIPIIRSWKLEGNLRRGYTISGRVNGRRIRGKIVSQDKNFITLDNDIQYFVMWSDFTDLEFSIMFTGEYLDMKYQSDFENIAGFKCRPVLFPK